MMNRLAVDLGGTNFRYKIYGKDNIEDSLKKSDIDILEIFDTIFEKYPNIEGIGVSFAGFINNGKIIESPNIDKNERDIISQLCNRYNIPVFIENDLNCAALAESDYYESDYLIALYSGTGIGAGIIDSGRLLKGKNGFAGEIGHIPYKKAPFRCGCGRYDCIENWASGRALIKWSEMIKCKEPLLKKLYYCKNKSCSSIAHAYIDALSYACGTLITLYNPEVLVFGGGVIDTNHWILPLIEKRLKEHTLSVSLKECRVEISKLENASLRGAKLLLDSSLI